MKKFASFEEFKRVLYLSMIPLIVLAIITYIFMETNKEQKGLSIFLSKFLLAWYLLSWILVYRKRLMRFVELSTLFIITFAHIAIVYDAIIHSLGVGQDVKIGVSVIWVPAVLLTFFLILRGRQGTVYSLAVFLILLMIGIGNLSHLTGSSLVSLAQFYFAYLFYILVFYSSIYLFSLFTEIEGIKKYAFTDALTGISNRHHIDASLESRIQDLQGSGKRLTLIFFDVDHFKKVNDHFGHKSGDSVLRELSSLVKSFLSEHELFGRWGGEEFIILTDLSGEEGASLAAHLLEQIRNFPFTHAGRQTVSFGVTEFRQGDTVDSLLIRADQGLYISKNNGRNMVTLV
ncbi:GGDEF domain-containing protein [Peribacillus sp. SCS-37]|uniref:GGDEF domain-containing protein n=1 Tax=Paraperibacillus esterisolvens TaxID=3115296 RepID=UPI003905FD27